jgi:hypothetical protein
MARERDDHATLPSMAIAIVPILLIIIGILVNLLTDKAKDIGRAMYWAGFFALAFKYAAHMIRIG